MIDADALIGQMDAEPEGGYYSPHDVISLLMTQPVVEERKKGKWISLDDFRGKYNTYGYKCSECGEHSEYEEKYCPNCGADMRGESNETD